MKANAKSSPHNTPANIHADRLRSHSTPSGAHLTDLTATLPLPQTSQRLHAA